MKELRWKWKNRYIPISKLTNFQLNKAIQYTSMKENDIGGINAQCWNKNLILQQRWRNRVSNKVNNIFPEINFNLKLNSFAEPVIQKIMNMRDDTNGKKQLLSYIIHYSINIPLTSGANKKLV